jgi:hypothetical protein
MAFGDFTVTRASTKLRIGSNGLYGSVANNVPAFEFNTDGTYRGLLVEPGATNLMLESQTFSSATWSKNATGVNTAVGTSGIQANVATAPDGTMTADRVNFLNQADADSGLNQNVATSVSTAYTNSIFVKGEGTDIGKQIRVRIRRNTGTANTVTANITLTADWQRVSTNYTTLADNTNIQVVYSSAVGGAVTALIWQAQLETGSVATSPIVTTAGTASRVADVVSLTGASSLIGQTEGTLYAEVNVSRLGVEGYILRLDDGGVTNAITMRKLSTNEIRCVITATTSAGTVNLSSATVTTGVVRIAYAYKSGEIAISVNGATPVTTAGTFSFGTALSRVFVGVDISAGTWNDTIRSFSFFPTRLPNATLQSLSTP